MEDNWCLTDFLINHKNTNPVSFHMPGHKGRSTLYGIYGFGDFTRNIVGNDITEIPGADALQQPRERIKQIMDGYAELYGVKKTELLVNGSSTGLMAAVLASVSKGGKLLMGRNSHKSVYGALRLGSIEPTYIMPEIDEATGLQLGINPDEIEEALLADSRIEAVLVTSPNYYGVLSDIQRIADITHRHDKILIVDQAHGAHLKFFDNLNMETDKDEADRVAGSGSGIFKTIAAALQHERKNGKKKRSDIFSDRTVSSTVRSGDVCRLSNSAVNANGECLSNTEKAEQLKYSLNVHAAESCGADIVVNSTHKTLLSFTGSAILNICTDGPDSERIGEIVRMLQTTSPSYLLMGSLDINLQILNMDSHNLIRRWNQDVEYFCKEAVLIKGLGLINRSDMDMSKINITMSALGLSGDALAAELQKRNVWIELTHGDYVMLMTGIGNERGDYEDALKALREISVQYRSNEADKVNLSAYEYDEQDSEVEQGIGEESSILPERSCMDEQSVFSSVKSSIPTARLEQRSIPDTYESAPLYNAEGMVLYEALIPYPPGSPIACPGEVLSSEVIRYVQEQLAGGHTVIGVDEEGMIKISNDD